MYQVKIQDIKQLKQRITNAITSIHPRVLERASHQWRTHIEMRFQQNDSHVEHIIQIKRYSNKNVYFFYVCRLMGHPVYRYSVNLYLSIIDVKLIFVEIDSTSAWRSIKFIYHNIM